MFQNPMRFVYTVLDCYKFSEVTSKEKQKKKKKPVKEESEVRERVGT